MKNATDGQTIAVPALGSGIYAKSLVTAAYEFLQENPSHALREVHFVDNDPTAIEALMKEMTTRFKYDLNFQINELVRDRWRHYLGAASVTPPSARVVYSGDMEFETPEGMEIRLMVGNIAKSTVRVKGGQTRKRCVLAMFFKGGQTMKHCFLAIFLKGGQTRKHCFLAMFPEGGQTMKHCFLAMFFKGG